MTLILFRAYLWFALLEKVKTFELRRHRIKIPAQGRRVLLVCNQGVRRQYRLSTQMAEAHCTQRRGPYTADDIIADPELRGGILVSDEAIRRYLKNGQGYVYQLENARLTTCK